MAEELQDSAQLQPADEPCVSAIAEQSQTRLSKAAAELTEDIAEIQAWQPADEQQKAAGLAAMQNIAAAMRQLMQRLESSDEAR